MTPAFAHLIACSSIGMRAAGRTRSLAAVVTALILLPAIARALPTGSVTVDPVTVTQTTGEKPQSKVWKHAGRWWSVLCNSSGTQLRRLDTNHWTDILQLSTATDAKADVKVVGDTAHVLLYRGTASQLVSVQYVPATTSYALWSVRSSTVNITLDSGVEVGTIDMDSQGRMWLASDAATTVNVRWADRPYTTWSAPIQVASGINADDISSVTAFGGNKIGVFWSNQTTQRYGFRTHVDGTTPTTWTADEVPASQSALPCANLVGMADDHMHLAAASNGTVYAAVKTGCDPAIGEPVILLLVRRPAGTWDNAYTVDTDGTRPIVLVNETLNQVSVLYTQANGLNPIVYKDSPTSAIAFGSRQTVIAGAWNDVTSTKQIIGSDAVIMASSTTQASAVYRGSAGATFTITASAGAGGTISPSGSVTVNSGANQTFTITPNTGFHVAGVAVDGASQGAITTFTFSNVTANHTISATFAANTVTFTITASAGAGGTISPSGAVTVNSGANQSFTITANTGFHVVNVVVDGASQGAVTTFAFSNITANHTISATFAANAATFTLAVSAVGNGTVTKSPDLASYASGATVQLTALASAGNHFVAWSGDATGSVNPLTVTMNANKSITATFAPDAGGGGTNLVLNSGFETDLGGWTNYAATLARVAGGHSGGFAMSMTAPGTAPYGCDDSPNWVPSVAGVGRTYRFTAWVRSDNSTGRVKIRVYEYAGSAQVGATFYSNQPALTTGWQLLTADYVVRQAGTTLSMRVTSEPSAAGQSFLVDDVGIELLGGGGGPASFTLNLSTVGNGSVTKAPDQPTYTSGATVQLTAVPSSGNHFVAWSGDASGSVNPLTVTMDANKSITATFAPDAGGGGTNLVLNPGFETDLSGWAHYDGATLARVPGGHSGASALQLTATATTAYGCDDKPNWVPAVAGVGRTYRFTAWVRSDNSTGRVKIRVYEYAGSAQVGTTFYSNQPALTTGWQLLTANYVVRQVGTTLSMRVTSEPAAAGQSFLVDDVGIELLPVAVPAFAAQTAIEDAPVAMFGARLVPSPMRARASSPGALHLTTTVAGPVKAQLFDVAGRVVHTLMDVAWAPAGTHTLHLGAGRATSLEPGIYHYRVHTGEGVLTGRAVLLP